MEIKYLIQKIREKSVLIAVITAICGVTGVLYYFIPPTYTAQGSFYIFRDIQPSEDGSFSYEGYYSQQVAISFAKTFSALIESPDIGSKVLKMLDMDTTESRLRAYRHSVKVVKSGPQLITLRVKAKDPGSAKRNWNAINAALSDSIDESIIHVEQISENPVVVQSYRNIVVFTALGVSSGFLAGIIFVSLKEYFSN